MSNINNFKAVQEANAKERQWKEEVLQTLKNIDEKLEKLQENK